jgi:acetyl-CoA carboxylase biotin carboxylase subunit
LRDELEAAQQARRVGFPVMLKAAGGGGGRGMRVARDARELERGFRTATEEALRAFGNPAIFIERFVERPRHIEFQIVADQHGRVWCLGERECSLQRRHQKVIEEAPSPALDPRRRERLGQQICEAVRATGYATAATFEFLMDEQGELYFMEVNTRIQVEHPVTEAVTGVDLVELQLRTAAGESLDVPEGGRSEVRGHAIECRINAEDPRTFAPWPGLITEYHPPGGAGIRVDSGVFGGWRVPSCYDSLLAKIIAWGADRAQALARMRIALEELVVDGIRTNIPLHRALLLDPDVQAGLISTRTIEELTARGF